MKMRMQVKVKGLGVCVCVCVVSWWVSDSALPCWFAIWVALVVRKVEALLGEPRSLPRSRKQNSNCDAAPLRSIDSRIPAGLGDWSVLSPDLNPIAPILPDTSSDKKRALSAEGGWVCPVVFLVFLVFRHVLGTYKVLRPVQ